MSKVKLTREQANAMKGAENQYGKDITVIRHAEKYFHGINERTLRELTTAEIARALYIGYEIEETIEVGDWVTSETTGRVVKVTGKSEVRIYVKYEDGKPNRTWTYGESRHSTPEEIATEKERRWWASHDRKVGELREKDVLTGLEEEYPISIEAVTENSVLLNTQEYVSREVIECYKVICFAENRLDGKDVEHE